MPNSGTNSQRSAALREREVADVIARGKRMTEQGQDPAQLIAELERKQAELADRLKQLKEQHEGTRRPRDSEEHELLWRQRHETLMKTLEGLGVALAALGATFPATAPSSASRGPGPRPAPAKVMLNIRDNPLITAIGDVNQQEAARQSAYVTPSLDKSGELSIQYVDSKRKVTYEVHVGNVVDALANAGIELLPQMSAVVSFRVGNDLLEATVTLQVGFLSRRRKLRLEYYRYTKDEYSSDTYGEPEPPRLDELEW